MSHRCAGRKASVRLDQRLLHDVVGVVARPELHGDAAGRFGMASDSSANAS